MKSKSKKKPVRKTPVKKKPTEGRIVKARKSSKLINKKEEKLIINFEAKHGSILFIKGAISSLHKLLVLKGICTHKELKEGLLAELVLYETNG